MTDSHWLSAESAAEYLCLSRKALYEAVRRGELPAYRFGKKRLRFRREELDALLQSSPVTTCFTPQIDEDIL